MQVTVTADLYKQDHESRSKKMPPIRPNTDEGFGFGPESRSVLGKGFICFIWAVYAPGNFSVSDKIPLIPGIGNA